MSRPTFDVIWMGLAHKLSERGTCARLQVGCVIASLDNRQIYAIGYNGNAEGFPNCCDSVEPGACGCLHAEDNAVINCTAPRGSLKLVYCTHLPCVMCAKRLVNLGGVLRVFYATEYRLTASKEVFERARIELFCRTEY